MENVGSTSDKNDNNRSPKSPEVDPPCINSESKDYKDLDEERRFLEELFAKRFNYYSLFAAAFLFTIFQVYSESNQLLFTLAIWAGISFFLLMLLAIWRTNSLINRVLDEILKYCNHPYTKIVLGKEHPDFEKKLKEPKKLERRFRSNNFLVLISAILFVFMFVIVILNTFGVEIR
ncbi:hypothetical protein [Gilvibacter sediminis]|uniref:hypothetical protein n=1 Tax=Gilvibacter sediminis TaxID=379071 RepID=UPI00234FFDA6|nr:hypothetical protein [Gilvibacter sediminis]MDC7998031.1 hypothetical protein [Gilvibacter sediminis]